MILLPEYGWRITKYNPIFRDETGAYQKDKWTSFSDIEKSFDGEVLTFEQYRKTEDAYVFTALSFLSEANLESLKVNSLETNNLPSVIKSQHLDIEFEPKLVKNGMIASGKILEDICRLVLRETIWCRLESEKGFYIHFGWDYYMYVGSLVKSDKAIAFGQAYNLFIEERKSPYISNDDE